MTDIVVVVVNWNACEDLRLCLLSLHNHCPAQWDITLWVVDNNSSDGSSQMVHQDFPRVNIIQNPDNWGFAKANNQAIAATHSQYVFLLNSDATLHPGFFEALIAFAEAHPQAGVIGPKVLNPDGTLQFSCRRFPTLGAGFFRNTYIGRLFPKNRFARNYLMGDTDHTKARPVDWISGCAMLIRRDLIERIGPLDERFFMYCEDVDFCWRCWQAGQQVWYAPQAIVTHAIGGSSNKAAERMIIEFHRSWYDFDKKRHPGFNPIRRLAVFSGLWIRAAIRIRNRRRAVQRSAKRRADATVSVEQRP